MKLQVCLCVSRGDTLDSADILKNAHVHCVHSLVQYQRGVVATGLGASSKLTHRA